MVTNTILCLSINIFLFPLILALLVYDCGFKVITVKILEIFLHCFITHHPILFSRSLTFVCNLLFGHSDSKTYYLWFKKKEFGASTALRAPLPPPPPSNYRHCCGLWGPAVWLGHNLQWVNIFPSFVVFSVTHGWSFWRAGRDYYQAHSDLYADKWTVGNAP